MKEDFKIQDSINNINDGIGNIAGKTVVLSGGTTGIGRAAAELLVFCGAKVLIYGRHEKELADALSDISKACRMNGEIHGMTADQSKQEEVQKVFERADSMWDKIDILINNAALSGEGVLDMDENDLRYVLESNILGYVACTKLAAERMRKYKSGHIINIGSMSADVREEGSSVYVASKAAIQAFSESVRKEVNRLGIKVTLIEPGKVGTDMQKETPEEQRELQAKNEMLKASDIALCVYYCLVQPERCDIVEVKIRPHLQAI